MSITPPTPIAETDLSAVHPVPGAANDNRSEVDVDADNAEISRQLFEEATAWGA